MIESGKKLSGRYLILGNIGSGGMANVFLARDLILDREVAVKVLRYDFQDNKDAIRRFQREALAATELVHPNIVSVYDVGEEDGMQYLVMEYVKGMDLKRYIQTHYPMDYTEIVDIMQQVLSAVALAHHHRIIHRDLKPQNILMNEDGVVKIADFGIAIALSETSITQTNTMLGSVHYLSPEQARGSMATNQSDIYAIGIILYEMLTGHVPFDGESAVTIALKHFQDELPSIRVYDKELPQSLENVVLKATAKEPTDRYKTADEMQNDLSTVLSPSRLNEPRWEPQAMIGETKILTPIDEDTPMPESFKEMPLPKPKPEVKEEPEKPAKKKKKWWLWFFILAFLAVVGTALYFGLGGGRDQVTVPDVANLTEAAARDELDEIGLNVAKETQEVANEDIEEGHVVKTDPEAKAIVKRNKEVVLYISSGSPKVTMQDYVGEQVKTAISDLEKEGFDKNKITSEEVFDSTVPAGEIIEQTPDADEEVVAADTEVEFTVSKGPETVIMPYLIGYDERSARAELANNGLGNSEVVIEETPSDSPAGTIIYQNPESSTEVVPNDVTITLTVSTGPEKVTVPDVVDQALTDADKALRDEGFNVEIEEKYDESVEAGHVISSSPSAGSEVDKGSTVKLVVSKGKEEAKTKTFTVNVQANYNKKEDKPEQTITVWLEDSNNSSRTQVAQDTVSEDRDTVTFPITVTIEDGKEATIYAQRDDESEVSKKVTGATTLQVP
ncbi:Stk1 family PASTA domain-containing Ser/Thr kinase [Enterococcus saccharolyticus]|uniref:Stk1 family PASTA domain-containing Ser/Thr kinase n=1 Tax=Enterococcus saccharolyticus TaxID=41997 RepID=UPI001E401405|nr:Stk1 family PASTA domain-containing Ser/Thr kinase [Enterococcus saccharolyticus]MCD5002009.1 Stk1 family PASTA domain-containing Ser/Thr kinase [Enterococcus saccharolyticus]